MKRPLLLTSLLAVVLGVAALAYHLASRGAAPGAKTLQSFAAANRSMLAGDRDAAIAAYQSLLDQGQHSAALYFNLATAQHLAGHLGAAILNYERAAALDPGAPDIAANLAQARRDAAVPEAEPAGWNAFAHALAPNTWSTIAAVSLLALAALAAIPILQRGTLPRKLTPTAALCALVALALSVAAIVTQHRDTAGRSIVLQAGTPLRVAPFEAAEPLATLVAGKTVFFTAHDSHHGFHLVRLDSGQTGWVRSDEAEIITQL